MIPIKNPPYYVVEAWPIVNNTQGGPEHDVKQRVLDPMKQPIRRLYVVAEISSIYGHLYLEAGNITECFVAGKNRRAKRRSGKTVELVFLSETIARHSS